MECFAGFGVVDGFADLKGPVLVGMTKCGHAEYPMFKLLNVLIENLANRQLVTGFYPMLSNRRSTSSTFSR